MPVGHGSNEGGEREFSNSHAGPSHPPGKAKCLATVRTDYAPGDQCYVLHLAQTPGEAVVAAALSTRTVKLFSTDASGLRFTGDLKAHTHSITGMVSAAHSPAALYTASGDGVVRAWDLRAGAVAQEFRAGCRGEALSVAVGPTLVAAGVADNLALWDARSGRQMAHWGDTHAQDVTAVQLHPDAPAALVSGSEDGLLAVFDLSAGLDEDESFQAALNIDNAVAATGWYGQGGTKLWCTTGTETLHLWEWQAACNEEGGGGQGSLADVADARAQLSALTPDFEGGVSYLVGCSYDAASETLGLMGGSLEGGLGIYPVVDSDAVAPLRAPLSVLAGGHADIVRCALHLGGGRVVTGGEDARVCLWDLTQNGAPSPPTTSLGEMASYYLSVQPHLFQETVDRQFSLLQEAKEKDQASESGEGTSSTSTDLVLSRRMAEVQRAERGRAVEDLMYVCILGKFRDLGVDMLPRIEEVQESSDTLRALTEGVHSREALDMVKEHVLGVLGPASMAYAATKIKMSALQAAQVYAASVLFGYFLRRVDTRFQLAKSLDMLPESQEEAVARLERLFSAADDGLPEGATPHPEVPGSDAAAAKPAEESEAASSDRPPADQPPPTSALVKKTKGALRRYVESFDQQTMLDMAKWVGTGEAEGLFMAG
ncbi:WD repeat-containing protein 89-like protein [Auxenochlorella protothecoides]|uniref:WD repeat-containing protein 89-like protein n=1 Tax=Auxenochlorella protothecoides TaxID=3075 RepID=A0A087SL10_AUXPR|nr:WD repeat-containing protein 89-like protein [Auxenochlorella protothecoides]KFM26414.1 WD repeat-containing protein 89-like protein [Auxenochlorella protothecoides]